MQPLSPASSLGSRCAATWRYARRHRILLVVGATAVVVGAVAAGVLLRSGSPYVARRPINAGLVKSPLVGAAQGTGGPLLQIGVPTIVRFVPRGTFAIAVIVTNKAAAPITLERATAILPRHSALHQIGTRLVAFKPPVCPRGAHCPFWNPIGPGPYGVAASPVPLTVAPGHSALAQLNFQLAPCWSNTVRASATARSVTVVYRSPDGTAVRQRLGLGDSIPKLTGVPARRTCRS